MTAGSLVAALLAGCAAAALLPWRAEEHVPEEARRSTAAEVLWWRWPAVILGSGGAAVLVGGPLGMALGPVAGLLLRRYLWHREPAARRRRRERLTRLLPHVVDLMAACLAAGASPVSALERVAAAVDPLMIEELRSVTDRLALGVDPVRVWRQLGEHPQLGPLGRCIARSAESGASVAEAMRRLADDQRRDARAEVEARARAVGVKAAVPLGVCLLPAFILVGIVPLAAGSLTLFLH